MIGGMTIEMYLILIFSYLREINFAPVYEIFFLPIRMGNKITKLQTLNISF